MKNSMDLLTKRVKQRKSNINIIEKKNYHPVNHNNSFIQKVFLQSQIQEKKTQEHRT